MTGIAKVIFACVHNAGRSQMAAAFFNQLCAAPGVRAVSAGTRPGPHVHPEVLAAMAEVGVDLSAARPQLLTSELAAGAALLVTMGCGEECPFVPGLRRADWPLEDPKGRSTERVREIRDDIRRRVLGLLAAQDWAAAGDVDGVSLRPARPDDLPRVAALLEAQKLPLQGVAEHLADFIVAVRGTEVVGAAGEERYGADRLLRSVVVDMGAQRSGLGARLVAELLTRAKRDGAQTMSLLTTTAEAYFTRFGFRRVGWNELPTSLTASAELTGACPSSAVAMRLDLAPR